MGVTHVTVTVRNRGELAKSWEGLFLVDMGAIDSLVPKDCLESIGLQPKAQRTYELADGSEVKMDITTGESNLWERSSEARSSAPSPERSPFQASPPLNPSGST